MSFRELSLLCFVAKISILFLASFFALLLNLYFAEFHTSSFRERKFKCGANDF
jgi:hypothetical protein